MKGPELAAQEIAAALSGSVARMEAVGLDHAAALNHVARENNVPLERLVWLLDAYPVPDAVEVGA